MPYTASGRKSTSTDHRLQAEKPTCSEKTEKNRLRRATGLPVDSQKTGSSGRQSSIQRPGRVGTATGAVRCRVGGGGAAMGQNGGGPSFPRRCCRAELLFRCAHRRTPAGGRPPPAG